MEKYDLVSQNVLVAKFPEYFYEIASFKKVRNVIHEIKQNIS